MSEPHSTTGVACLDFVNSPFDGDALFGGAFVSAKVVASARQFHASLSRFLRAEASGEGAREGDIRVLNRVLLRAGGRRGLLSTVRGYGWGWLDESADLTQLLWPIAFSAARLLEGPDLERLKGCGGCGRLFLDRSRNRSRRWCDMEGCGNRAKQRRWREAR